MSTEKQNRLFAAGPFGLNACVGGNGPRKDLWVYAVGYRRAGDALVREAFNGDERTDFIVYPIVYNYRHAIELYLKALWVKVHFLCGNPRKPIFTHSVVALWAPMRLVMDADRNFRGAWSCFDEIEYWLKQVDEFDPVGETFRFPETKKGECLLENTSVINIAVLYDGFSIICDIIDGLLTYTEELWDAHHELQAYERSRQEKTP